MKHILAFGLFLSIGLVLSSCGGDDPNVIDGPGPVVDDYTKMVLTLTDPTTNESFEFLFDEENPNINNGVDKRVSAGVDYTATIKVSDSKQTPEKDLTEFISDENASFQFFFTFAEVDATYTYGDADRNAKPIGLLGTIRAEDTALEARIRVQMVSQPDKDASGVPEGNQANAGGTVEIDADFIVVVL